MSCWYPLCHNPAVAKENGRDVCSMHLFSPIPEAQRPPADVVNHPSHYTTGKIEVWDFILDQQLSYLAGNVIKYICRYARKGKPIEDLKKARAYLNKLIEQLEAK